MTPPNPTASTSWSNPQSIEKMAKISKCRRHQKKNFWHAPKNSPNEIWEVIRRRWRGRSKTTPSTQISTKTKICYLNKIKSTKTSFRSILLAIKIVQVGRQTGRGIKPSRITPMHIRLGGSDLALQIVQCSSGGPCLLKKSVSLPPREAAGIPTILKTSGSKYSCNGN